MLIGLNDKQRAKLEEWIASKNIRRECTACGKDDWDIRGLMAAHQYYRTVVRDLGRAESLVLMVCNNCSQARLFGGQLIGLA
jgi:hypothetical protein